MPYTSNEPSYNPYNYPSPYRPGQSLPEVDESEMMDIGSLQKFSMVYCNNLPIGSCTNYQIGETLHCQFVRTLFWSCLSNQAKRNISIAGRDVQHSCLAKLTDGSHCPNPSTPGSRYCATGYHEENGRYPILHSPRSSFSQDTDGTPGSQTITACNSFESVYTAASQSHQPDHSATQAHHTSEQQHHAASPIHLPPSAYQSQQTFAVHYPSQGARIQWTTQHAQSQPTYHYYAPDEGGDIGYHHVAGSAGSESEWGTIEKRSL